ncbi:hypothetical protein HMPREF3164_04780 [Rothia sp. HMSC08A08]|uniref:hypothetical protein n=1 Tax=Rothia sp. HMSC08A08 TaxID=1581132 RepID=UPI0008A168B7|nr:hypothetical protein [Rothia sp. HMSC08A08]OFS80874.1 hypothetical protein HMPREF3164_04780 [Rothia sp. HMSC08A08]
MTIISSFSSHGSPGVSVSSLALALTWENPVLLIEADTTAPSSVMAGFMQAAIPYRRGISYLIESFHTYAPSLDSLWAQLIPLAQDPVSVSGGPYPKHLLAAAASPAAAAGYTSFWADLMSVCYEAEKAGVDTIIDLGRITDKDPRLSILSASTVTLAHLKSTLVDISAAQENITRLGSYLESSGKQDSYRLILHESLTGNYPAREVAATLNVPVAATLPYDPMQAAYYSYGIAPSGKHKSKYPAALRQYATTVQHLAQQSRSILEEV